MTATFRFHQLDVFTATPLKGNPLAVVHGADGARRRADAGVRALDQPERDDLPAAADRRPAPTTACASSRPARELPFAGHPTLGSCHAWLAAGGQPRGGEIVQQCGVGLVRIRRDGERLAFAAPPLLRSGAVEPAVRRSRSRAACASRRRAIRATQWVDNGPGWVAALLDSRDAVLALQARPRGDRATLELGVVGAVAGGRARRGAVRGARVHRRRSASPRTRSPAA